MCYIYLISNFVRQAIGLPVPGGSGPADRTIVLDFTKSTNASKSVDVSTFYCARANQSLTVRIYHLVGN